MRTTLFDATEAEVASAPTSSRSLPSGAAVAALLGAMLGILTLSLVNWGTAASKPFNAWVHGVGKLWMPGAEGIGQYSGKETLSLAVWIGSWLILHAALRNRELDLARWLVV